MIRHRRGDEFLLIAQHDHALLSGEFARHVGNRLFATPSPFDETILGVSMHDCGWPGHDEQPTLNADGLPLHVLESPMAVAIPAWSESARRSAEQGDYPGLLVSLHVMALSAIAQTRDRTPHERARDAREVFDLNKFQHRQAEHQEALRRRLGMRTDLPLCLGLAEPGMDETEDLLMFNYNLLKTCDRLSLDLCCSEDLFPSVDGVYPRPGGRPLMLSLGHRGEGSMTVSPWPFGVGRLEFDVPGRRVPAKAYRSAPELHDVLASAPPDKLRVRLEPG